MVNVLCQTVAVVMMGLLGVAAEKMLLSATSTTVAVSSFVTIRLAVSRVHATVGIHYHSMAFCVMM